MRLSHLLMEGEILRQIEDGHNGPGEYEILDQAVVHLTGPLFRMLSLCRFRDLGVSTLRLLMSSTQEGIGGRRITLWQHTWLLDIKSPSHVRQVYDEMVASGFHKQPKAWRAIKVEPQSLT